ncbi:MAG: MoxR family ATPase [Bacillota bacterium]|nr:MoxR family ATPase [Bacillota bacterium]
MNIAEAKQQIVNAMTSYFTKDRFGNYRIPVQKQRPVFLIGPPGVGKTAIMEQVAAELGVGLVSYSMTHHTRQSALGLPYITTREFGGKEYQVSEYTMSEIIGSVYQMMRETGVKEGILFLDEINCISETLAPCMLQFLQYKVFGQHRIPDGWIVVTAGNPPEYNKAVRDFDIVTWDRLKRIDVEPDYQVWKTYAYRKGVHPAVTTYLAARKKDFYKVESTVDGKHFVTARGWDDLSEMIHLYEENKLTVDELLISQYLQDPKIARDFAIYYDLFNKYRSDYQVERILEGTAGEEIVLRAQQAQMDERLSLLGLIFDAVTAGMRRVCEMEDMMDLLTEELKKVREAFSRESGAPEEILEKHSMSLQKDLEKGRKASSLSTARQHTLQQVISALEEDRALLMQRKPKDKEEAFALIKEKFNETVAGLKKESQAAGDALDHVFGFCEEAFAEGDEILIFVTELTANYYSARFIGHYGCDKYYVHNKELQFQERNRELISRVEKLDWQL